MSRKIYKIPAIILITIILTFAEKSVQTYAEEPLKVSNGIYIDQVNVSQMTEDQAKDAVNAFVNDLKVKGLAISVGDKVVYTTMGDLGYNANINDVVKQAIDFGKTGNLIKRYKDLKDIEQGNKMLPLNFNYDENKIKDIVSKNVSKYNVKPVNASVSRVKGKLVYTDHVVGKKVNVNETTKAIKTAIEKWDRKDIVVEAVIEDDMPVYTKDIVEQCNTVLGTYTTEYYSSALGRAANLANGARLINNTVLYPGDTFSAYEHLEPFTEENGYKVAGAYLQGKVIDSVGGGACQVTTTLYNTVLLSELEVVERQPHSMTISYVDLSRDAAIAGTSKDFKFKNNTDVPILIEASTYNRKITFKIWGHEKRDMKNRKIDYVSEVISKTNPPADIITKDPTKPTTFREVTTAAHTGYRARLYKIVYVNGVQVSKDLVNTSNYQAAARCITIGTKEEKEEKKEPQNTEKKSKTESANKTESTEDKSKKNSGKTNVDSNVDDTENAVEEESSLSPDGLTVPDEQDQ